MSSIEMPDMAPELGLVPPHSIEAEQSVLGGLMLDNTAWDWVCDRLTGEAFYRWEHRCIFNVIQRLAESDRPVDIVTLSESLEKEGQLERVGGLAYLAELARNTPSAANIGAYGEIVYERFQLRQLSQVASELNQQVLGSGNAKARELIETAERKLFMLAEDKRQTSTHIQPALSAAIDAIDRAYHAKGGVTGTPTGFKDLDALTGGWQASDLIVIAGRPSMGKTTLGMNLVEHALLSTTVTTANAPVFVFSQEMPASQLMLRLLAGLGRLDLQQLRTGRLDDDDWPKLTAAATRVLEFKDRLHIDDESGLTATAIKSRARRMKRRHGHPSLVLIDYLQLLHEPGYENRTNEISAISRLLKATAKELNCPVIALSQLNRSVENRPNKRPIMADLRDSGAIEQDADVIAFVYRDEVYHPDNPDNHGLAELIIGKQRNGPMGTVHLYFLSESTRFESLEWKRTEGMA